MRAKIAIFGGSFDPFHLGHRKIIEAAQAAKKYDEFIVLPTGTPAYKDRALSPATYRFATTKAGLEGLDGITISTLELESSDEISYTADTLIEIKKLAQRKYGHDFQLYLIYGSDALDSFAYWYKPREILQEAKLQIALRGKDAQQAEHYQAKAEQLMAEFGGKISFFAMPAYELSSSELRLDLVKGKVKDKFYPPATAAFLRENRPYIFAHEYQALPAETHRLFRRYEQAIWFQMSEERRIHSVNVAMFALHLANLYRVDTSTAFLAGLLHDACKHFPYGKQLDFIKESGFDYPVNPSIAHGPASAYWIKKELGVTDPDILNAVCYHTTGRPSMSALEKIVYLSDKLEFGRDYKDLEPIRQVVYQDLDKGLALCVQDVAKALERKGASQHILTMGLIEELKERKLLTNN
ncbi:MAG: bis(5'-nucleosyl)-tetraphosphatase (symmetrical) YqeK [Eubacteriales bacterium]|nr:bis(5'-nucleosyl)-tetraphosphatase (symmetrical) YqeK [Eubacteriales bacterium]